MKHIAIAHYMLTLLQFFNNINGHLFELFVWHFKNLCTLIMDWKLHDDADKSKNNKSSHYLVEKKHKRLFYILSIFIGVPNQIDYCITYWMALQTCGMNQIFLSIFNFLHKRNCFTSI